MSDFLIGLLQRHRTTASPVRPRLGSLFEPAPLLGEASAPAPATPWLLSEPAGRAEMPETPLQSPPPPSAPSLTTPPSETILPRPRGVASQPPEPLPGQALPDRPAAPPGREPLPSPSPGAAAGERAGTPSPPGDANAPGSWPARARLGVPDSPRPTVQPRGQEPGPLGASVPSSAPVPPSAPASSSASDPSRTPVRPATLLPEDAGRDAPEDTREDTLADAPTAPRAKRLSPAPMGKAAVSPRPLTAGRAAEAPALSPEPGRGEAQPRLIRVTIGRIEVRAQLPERHEPPPPPPVARPAASSRRVPALSLSDYLKQRGGRP